METIVEHVDVWAANIEDKPGGLAGVLSLYGMWGPTCNSSLRGVPR